MAQYLEQSTGNIMSQADIRNLHKKSVSFSTVIDTYAELGYDEITPVAQPTPSSPLKDFMESAPAVVDGVLSAVWVEVDRFSTDADGTKTEKEEAYHAGLTAATAEGVRTERDAKLAATDWQALSDITMTAEMTTYRQALRDVPAQAGFPNTIDWPNSPQ